MLGCEGVGVCNGPDIAASEVVPVLVDHHVPLLRLGVHLRSEPPELDEVHERDINAGNVRRQAEEDGLRHRGHGDLDDLGGIRRGWPHEPDVDSVDIDLERRTPDPAVIVSIQESGAH